LPVPTTTRLPVHALGINREHLVVGTGNEAGHLNPVAFSHASAKFWHVTVLRNAE